MTATANFAMSHLLEGQAGAEVLVNESLNSLDMLLHLTIQSSALTAPPGSPVNGQVWLVAAGATGAWSGEDGNFALYYDGWQFLAPREGMRFWNASTNKLLVYNGATWDEISLSLAASALIGASIALSGTVPPIADFLLTSADGDGAVIVQKLRSDAKTVADSIGLAFHGRNSTPADFQYGCLAVKITDPTAGSEDSVLQVILRSAGSNVTAMEIHPDGSLYIEGVKRIDADGFLLKTAAGGLTASTTQTQGQMPLTAEINHVTTCANANDTVTLPPALAGRVVHITNRGATTLQVFPASGDKIGTGAVDAATTQTTSQRFKTYYCYTNGWWEFHA